MRVTIVAASLALLVAALGSSQPASAQFKQQGSKLVGTGAAVGTEARQGYAVAVSADGNTAIIGGFDDGSQGATWVFTRSNGVWSQQGAKLVGTGGVLQGYSAALSADGNTAIVGGRHHSNIGMAWVFTRENGVWRQQAQLSVEAGANFGGTSVALSDDGNTAIIGSSNDNNYRGAAWIFTRSNGVWRQQGHKLVGSNSVGSYVYQGSAVALSGDGNTAMVGGYQDNNAVGAVWVFTRSNGVWTQQGGKLTGTGLSSAQPVQGRSVALSADGNIAMVGAPNEGAAGVVLVFVRRNGVWGQQGMPFAGTGAVGSAGQGMAVALSAKGDIAVVGGPFDNSNTGAVWTFTRSGGAWSQLGGKLVGSGAVRGNPDFGEHEGLAVALSADGHTAAVGGPDDNYIGATWIYVQAPLVSSVSPATGSARGHTLVAITGEHFTGATAVKFGQIPAAKFNVISDTRINAVTPAHPAGAVPVWVATPAGKRGKAKAYTFQ